MGVLYLIGTPIGNLEDITLRALRILAEVPLVAAEDTRRARILLSHYELTPHLISYFEGNEANRVGQLLDALSQGDVAVISEAGMPGLSDPGYNIVVTFGGNPATDVVVNPAGTQITAVTPAGTGTVDVVVTNPGGQTGILTNGYTYGDCFIGVVR